MFIKPVEKYTDPRKSLLLEQPCKSGLHLRSSQLNFDWKQKCLFCCQYANDDKHRSRSDVRSVETIPFRYKPLQVCNERSDSWSNEVRIRLNDCIDLVAAEAIYHKACHRKFTLNKKRSIENIKSPGRPESHDKSDIFQRLCNWLDTEVELYTVTEFHTKMLEISAGNEIYNIKRLKQKLQEYYGDIIFFAEYKGRNNIVCFRNTANYIINSKWYDDRQDNIGDEAIRIIRTAAKIIRGEIREAEYDVDFYPGSDHIKDNIKGKEWLPRTLQVFMSELISSNLKQVSLGQCIVKAARPNSCIPPLMFALSIELDHMFGSKWLLSQLSRLGLCLSYNEVTRYKQSVVNTENVVSTTPQCSAGSFTQWVADNVDHNIATIDGHNTFHGMGIIAVTTPPNTYETNVIDERPILG